MILRGTSHRHYFLKMRAFGNIVFWILQLIGFGLCAQNDPARFIHFTIADGLPSSGIRSLATDPEGFVWIGTLNGLARWDGHSITAFNALVPRSGLPEDDIKLLFCDSHGFLWLKFLNNSGLFRINLATYQVSAYQQDFFKSRETFPPKAIEDQKGDIWFATIKGLSKFNYASQTFNFFPLTYKGRKDITVQVCQTPDGKIWVSTRQGIFLFHPDTKQYERFPLYANDEFQHVIASDKEGHLWIGRWYDEKNGVLEYDPAQRRILRFFIKKRGFINNFHTTDISHIYPDGDKIWFCCNEGGLCVFNKKNNEIRRYEPIETDPESLKTWSVLSFTRDTYGNYWVGTESTLDFLPFIDKTAQLFTHNPYVSQSLVFSKTNTVAALSNGNMVFGADRGLSIYNIKQQSWHSVHLPIHENSPYNDVILSLAEHDASSFWAGSWDGLYLLDKRSGAIKQAYPVVSNSPYVRLGTPTRLMRDSLGVLWVAFNKGSIRHICNGTIEYLDELIDDENSANDQTNCFAEQNRRYVFVGTCDGLVRYDQNNRSFKTFPVTFPGEQSPVNIGSLCFAKNGDLYLIANDRLYRLKMKDGGHMAEPIVFPFSMRNCLDLIEDQHGDIWVCTESGLARYDPLSNKGIFFDARNFLQGNTFYSIWRFNKSAKDANGHLYFAGISGISVLRPDVLAANASPPLAIISGLNINHETVALDSSIHRLSRIVLAHWQNNLSFEFSALGSFLPALNRYAYRLSDDKFWTKDEDVKWVELGNQHHVNFSNLSPGKYYLQVRAANSDGVWCDTPAGLQIIISQPWYQRWWAWMAYGLIVASLSMAFYRYQLRRRLDKAENARLREMGAFKSRFFTNITHEFRTPLTVILGMSEKVQEQMPDTDNGQQSRDFLTIIRRNGIALLRLVNEILDLSRLEVNALKLQYQQGNIVERLYYIVGSMQSLATAKSVQLEVSTSDNEIVMDYDPDRLMHILYNLLANAIKFTPAGGRIILSAQIIAMDKGARLEIMVADTGAGIPAEDVPYIFERYYQANNQAAADRGGAGIGLSYIRELVKLMHGEITVESQLNKGTTFTITLPITHNAPLETTPPLTSLEGYIHTPAQSTHASAPRTDSGQQQAEIATSLPQILIIEDNLDVMAYLNASLSGYYQVYHAYNGQSGIELAFEASPDLIVSDVMMPVKDGFEVCDVLKNDPRTSHIPIVLLTAKADVESRIAGLRRGADAYMAKPFDSTELLLQLRNLLLLRERFRERYAGMEPPAPAFDPGLNIEDAFLQQFREYVISQIDNPQLSVDDLCRAVGMGRTNLHHKITSLTGKSAMQYVRALRLHKAMQLLENTELNVSEIAFEVGFDDPKYFSRVFTEETGIAPSQWRKK